MPRPTSADFTELEIRIRALEEGGYPVEMTLDGEREFAPGVLDAGLAREVRRARWEPRQGAVLFEQLLRDPELRSAWDRAHGDGRRLRLRLRIDEEASELQALPWEAMASLAAGSLASGAATPFSRYLACDQRHGEPVRERPLRMLASIACPEGLEAHDLTAFDPEMQRRALEDALAEAQDARLLELSFLEPPVSPARLEQALRELRPHVLHLVAHGKLNPAGSALYLETDDRQVGMVSEEDFAASLGRLERPPQLVFLAACESAGGTVADAFRGLAPRLVRAGVPAVVAMQGKVPIALASEHAATFYRRLLAHGRVDLAANEARSQLLAADHPSVAYPVLFLRSRDGLLLEPAAVIAERESQTLFLCHGSRDAAAARELGSWLRTRGYRAVTLGFEPENGEPAWLGWERELHARMVPCRAVLLLASEHALASRFRVAEIAHARSLGKAVVPVKVEPCAIDPVLWGEREIVDLCADRAAGLGELGRLLSTLGLDARWPGGGAGGRPPYPGLAAFDERDAELYFGRESEIREGLDLLERLRRYGDRRFVVVVGASGSGKSSLLRAGLLPRWRRDPSRWLLLGPLMPGDEPVARLAGALADAFMPHGESHGFAEIRDALAQSDTSSAAMALERLARELRQVAQRREAMLLLLVDQLEESLGHAEGERFLGLLRAVLERPAVPFLVVATLRSDLLATLEQTPVMRGFDLEHLRLTPMGQAALAQVIEKPAALAAIEIEPGLVQELLAETETADALPLLAFTLRELYERHGGDARLELGEYRQLGGVEKAVERKADEVMGSLRLSGKDESLLRRAFLSLARVDDQGRVTRRTVPRVELPDETQPWLERFVRERLLVASGDGAERTLGVAHEALLRAWPKLAGWIAQNRAALDLRRELDQAAGQWEAAGRPKEDLWRRRRLRKVREIEKAGLVSFGERSTAFLEASKWAHQARWAMVWIASLAMAIPPILVFGALVLLVFFPENPTLPQSPNLVFSPDGARLFTGGKSGKLEVWELSSSEIRRREHELGGEGVLTLAFRSDGALLAAASQDDGKLRLVDPSSEKVVGSFDDFDQQVLQILYSPGGGELAVLTRWQLLILDGPGGRPLWKFAAFDDLGEARRMAFVPGGDHLVFATPTRALVAWDLATGEPLWELGMEDDRREVLGLAASHDGASLAYVVGDPTRTDERSKLKVVDLTTLATRSYEVDHAFGALAFSPDGKSIAFSAALSVVLLDLATGQRTELDNEAPAVDLAFRPRDSTFLSSVDAQGCVRIWRLPNPVFVPLGEQCRKALAIEVDLTPPEPTPPLTRL